MPPILTNTIECRGNRVFNDVVCHIGFRRSITVNAGDGNDNVVLFEEGLVEVPLVGLVSAPPVGCEQRLPATVTAVVRGGAGADDVFFVLGTTTSALGNCQPFDLATPRLRLRLSASGGPGADELEGGLRDDDLRGDEGEDVLGGGRGGDQLSGGADNDTLDGDDNDDTLDGGTQADQLNGGPGIDRMFGRSDNDTLNARDGVRDAMIDCGPGTDTAVLDTQDQLIPPSEVTSGRFNPGSACETVDQSPLDDGPPGRALRQRLRVARGSRVRVRVACPRAARVACRGVLTLRDPRSNRVLARGRYRVALGGKAAVALRARRTLPRRVAAEMLEQGVSMRGPRLSSRQLPVIG